MKVVCDNCGAVYKVPDDKLVKPVNKATCRQCGHRMLIPRPRADADPNERTLVTAVPPTPMGAPPRDLIGDRGTSPIDDEPEKTLPGRPAPAGFNRRSMARDEVPVFPGTPLPAQGRSSTSTADALRAAGGDTVKSSSARIGDTLPREEPALPHGMRHRSQASHPPRPQPMSASIQPPHDPSGDITVAIVGILVSLTGVFILFLFSVWPMVGILMLGLVFAIGGAIGAFFILVTSSRGRQPASLGLSIGAGVVISLLLASFLSTTSYVSRTITGIDLGRLSEIAFSPAPDIPPTLPIENKGPAKPTPVIDDHAVVVEPTEPEPQPVAPAPVAPRPAPVAPRPAPVAPRPAPVAPRPAPAPAPSSAVSYEVIDVMLRNNMSVKRCFFETMQATGALPPRVDVRFNLMPTGSVTGVSIQQPQYRGSALETCLGSAIRGVAFPPSSGNGQKIVYPFVLQR